MILTGDVRRMENHEEQRLIDDIFNQACEFEGSQLEEFLNQACGTETALRVQVERLLSADLEIRAASKNETKVVASDRNLLVGIVALQMNFVSRDALIQAMQVWTVNKKEPIENIFHAMGSLDRKTRILLTALVDKHLEHHDNDPEKSLASLSSIGDLRTRLNGIHDPEIDKSIQFLDGDFSSSSQDSSMYRTVGFPSKPGGRFRILRHHKDGGLGMISVARDEELNRNVALKEIRERYAENETARERLRIEAEITGGLEHPGIVPVYGLGNYDDGRPFYCMRFIKGDSLRGAIKTFHTSKSSLSRTQRILELRSLLRRFIDVCDAIGYAHSRSVLHRDLKPDNIMLGRFGETLVVDWGLAKAICENDAEQEISLTDQPIVPRSGSSAAPTMAGSAIGTPQYMSPEQAEGRIDLLGPATDVYSLGATLYCLLTGQSAFTSEDRSVVLGNVRNGVFPAPKKIDRSVPPALEAICLKSMQRDPSSRYQSPTDIGQDIERWLADEPVSVFSEPWSERLARFVRLHKTAFAGIVAALMMALIASAVIATLSKMKNNQLNELNLKLAQAKDELQDDFSNTKKLAFELIEKAESGKNSLAQIPGDRARKHRYWITNRAISVFKPLISRRPDDPDVKLDMAKLYRYAANLDRLEGEYVDSEKKYNAAIQHLEQIITAAPDDARDRLALTHADYASMLRKTHKLVESRQQLEKSGRFVKQLRAENPDSMKYRRSDGVTQMELAAVLVETGDPNEAIVRVKKCTELFEELVDSGNHTPLDPILLSLSMTKQSEILRSLNRLAEAEAVSQEAVERTQAAAKKNKSRDMQHALAKIYLERSHVLFAKNDFGLLVRKHLDDAIQIWGELKTRPRYLALALTALGRVQARNQRPEEARSKFERSISILSKLVEKESPDALEAISDALAEMAILELSLGHTDQAEELKQKSVDCLKTAVDLTTENKRLEDKLKLQNGH